MKTVVVAGLLALTIIGALGFAVNYAVSGQTQIAGLCLALAFGGFAAAMVVWERVFMTHADGVQDIEPLASAEREREASAEVFCAGAATIVGRRTWLTGMLAAAGGAIGIALLFPLRSLLPHTGKSLSRTAWTRGARFVDAEGKVLHASDLALNSVVTAFPQGHTGSEAVNDMANAAVMLVRVPANEIALPDGDASGAPDGLLAYSKVCTHAGCPVSLYRAAERQLFCPCHQSTFDVLRGGKQVFGPADRALPRLRLRIAEDGALEALGDFSEPIGPGFWNRA